MKAKQTHLRRIPVRTCVVCGAKDSKRKLTRLVRTESGLLVDPGGKINGRGAYLCDKRSCWERAVNTNLLNKPLRTVITAEDRERLQQAMP